MGVASWMMGMEHDCSNNGYRKGIEGKTETHGRLDMSDRAASLNTQARRWGRGQRQQLEGWATVQPEVSKKSGIPE